MRAFLQNKHGFGMKYVAFDQALIDHAGDHGFDVFKLQRSVLPCHPSSRNKYIEAHRRRRRRGLRDSMGEAQTVQDSARKGDQETTRYRTMICAVLDHLPFTGEVAPQTDL